MTDTERMDWLSKHCNYMEHDPAKRNDPGNYWPQEEGETYAIPDLCDRSLREYVDEMIERDKK